MSKWMREGLLVKRTMPIQRLVVPIFRGHCALSAQRFQSTQCPVPQSVTFNVSNWSRNRVHPLIEFKDNDIQGRTTLYLRRYMAVSPRSRSIERSDIARCFPPFFLHPNATAPFIANHHALLQSCQMETRQLSTQYPCVRLYTLPSSTGCTKTFMPMWTTRLSMNVTCRSRAAVLVYPMVLSHGQLITQEPVFRSTSI
ncbi:hypothetical protein BJV82DRAFT_613851 [Fennellomyces sp. T-0311]|nr:hypothetical protein BJV82DRAFT_613851 [Fennellomyces sp. T-0311]